MHELLGGLEFIMRGGFMMYPLLMSGAIALAVIIERVYMFLYCFHTSPIWLAGVLKDVESKQLSKAEGSCRQVKTPIAHVLLAGIEHLDSPVDELELVMKNRAEAWVPLLERRIEILDTVITAAPLMGLLGTITGMMASFRVLSEKGVNEPNAITGGVAEALIATATGLVIALCCLVAYNYLTARVKNLIYDMESAASHLMELRAVTKRKTKTSL